MRCNKSFLYQGLCYFPSSRIVCFFVAFCTSCTAWDNPAGAQVAIRRGTTSIEIANASFENVEGSVAFNEFTFGPPPGWTLYDPGGNVVNNGVGPQFWVGTLEPTVPHFFLEVAPHGQQVAIAFNVAGTGNQGEYGLQQNLTALLQPNFGYVLQVEIGNIQSGTAVNGDFFNLQGFPGYRVDLMAGGIAIASDNNSLAGLIEEGTWGTSTVTFQADGNHPLLGLPLGVRLVSLNAVDPAFPTADLEVDFDNVRLLASPLIRPAVTVVPLQP